uniref:DUF632 domain-containing protein n=1 Tax=Cajanus cajan TaxID=3821 RepID=A0A151TDW8_CAJCA|nr:hypothetical protein KK1_011426 [Cajanus cajan]
MGCAQSRIDNEESVCRCKDRKTLMKDAVVARSAFAAGHTYNPPPPAAAPPPPPPPPIDDHLPPPPPPLPEFSPASLTRAATMPAVSMHHRSPVPLSIAEEEEEEEDPQTPAPPKKTAASPAEIKTPPPPMPEPKGMAWDYFFMVENMPGPSLSAEDDILSNDNNINDDDNNDDDKHIHNDEGKVENVVEDEAEPKTPEKVVQQHHNDEENEMSEAKKHMEHSKTAPPELRRAIKVVPSVTLMQILSVLDDHFLQASESAQGVSKLLEATRLHYHSNFADNRGHIDHSARVMRVITWNKSFRGVSNGDAAKDDFDSEEYETHATVLDKLLAWEKKLYEEVKQGELMKFEYQRKVAILNKQKKRGASVESLEKTKAAVSHLHTRYIVDMQSMDSTVSEVNHIRDAQLYPKLVSLVVEMANMWEKMCMNHDSQLKIVTDLKSLDISQAPMETTKHHYERTVQLLNVVHEWHLQFEKLVTQQKQYIKALNSWLKLNLIPIESNLKEKISSPPKAQNPPIQALLHAWHDYVDKLPDELAKSAISSFAAVIKTIIVQQEEEMKLKERCEETRKEYFKKKQAFEECLKKRLEEEVESHQKHCVQVREKSLQSFKTRLPELFRALSDYAHACADAYEKLKSITQSQGVGA